MKVLIVQEISNLKKKPIIFWDRIVTRGYSFNCDESDLSIKDSKHWQIIAYYQLEDV